MYSEIGNRIRELRLENNMTLKDLSEQTGLSSSFISQLERGMTTIAIDSLDNIAKVFKVAITHFFSHTTNNQSSSLVQLEHERILLIADQLHTQYALSSDFDNKRMFPSLYRLNPSNSKEPLELYSHRGEEFVYVVYGILSLYINDQVFHLHQGDTFHIDASTPHNIKNNTSDIVKYLSVVIPDDKGPLVQTI
jgi:transcriptional regulator with XRE-family HTH domain